MRFPLTFYPNNVHLLNINNDIRAQCQIRTISNIVPKIAISSPNKDHLLLRICMVIHGNYRAEPFLPAQPEINMEKQDLRTLRILEAFEKDQAPSQRELASRLNISLGLVNSFIKRLSHKGYFKISVIPKNRIKYILTPKGFAEKSRLTYEYIRFSYRFYQEARIQLRALFREFDESGVNSVVFYGIGDFAEIAYLSLQETKIKLVAIVDDSNPGKRFLAHVVQEISILRDVAFDRIIITSDEPREAIFRKIIEFGIESKKITALM